MTGTEESSHSVNDPEWLQPALSWLRARVKGLPLLADRFLWSGLEVAKALRPFEPIAIAQAGNCRTKKHKYFLLGRLLYTGCQPQPTASNPFTAKGVVSRTLSRPPEKTENRDARPGPGRDRRVWGGHARQAARVSVCLYLGKQK